MNWPSSQWSDSWCACLSNSTLRATLYSKPPPSSYSIGTLVVTPELHRVTLECCTYQILFHFTSPVQYSPVFDRLLKRRYFSNVIDIYLDRTQFVVNFTRPQLLALSAQGLAMLNQVQYTPSLRVQQRAQFYVNYTNPAPPRNEVPGLPVRKWASYLYNSRGQSIFIRSSSACLTSRASSLRQIDSIRLLTLQF